MTIEIERAASVDAEAVCALINQAYAVEKFFVSGPRIELAEVVRLIESGFLWKASTPEEGLLGCIQYQPEVEAAYFGLLAVAPSARGLGLGRQLVRFVEDRARAEGIGRMTILVVNLRTELPPWYEKQGYRLCGTEPFSSPRQKLPCHFLRFEKPL